jgi:hypothetical protein
MTEPLRLLDDQAVVIGYVSDFYELLRAIDETMPKKVVMAREARRAFFGN